MSVIAVETGAGAPNGAAKPPGFWQRLAQALDWLVIYRIRREVSASALRRSRHEVERCRRLLLRPSVAPAAIKRGAQARQPRS